MSTHEKCANCRFWSELAAQSIGCGPIEAVCLCSGSPHNGKFVRATASCPKFENSYGHAIDEPGLPEGWHERLARQKARADANGPTDQEIDASQSLLAAILGEDNAPGGPFGNRFSGTNRGERRRT